jgi:hypothetical protein
MTAKRKAELQRKLALAPVPKPPTGLSDRIKSEIPKNLSVDADRTRFRQAVAFNVRVAASILLLVSSVYLALHLLTRKFGPPEAAAPASLQAANTETAATAGPIVLPSAPPSQEAIAQKAQQQSDRKQIIVAEARQEPLVTRTRTADKERSAGRADTRDTAVAQSAPTTVAEAPAVTAAAPLLAPSPLPPPPPPAGAAADSATAMNEMIRVAPSAKTMAASFDVEAAAAPFDASKQILRVSLDGVRDLTPDVAFNDDTVASWHTVTSEGTSLYEMTLRPQTGPNEIIVTARVNNTERVIRKGDLRSWNDASRRMKYATLAAALESGVSPKDVAAKARAAGLDDLAAAAEAKAKH